MNKFILFLKLNSVLTRFKHNLKKSIWHSDDNVNFYLEKNQNNESALMHAFRWINTPEGEDYWLNIDDKWDEFFIEKYKPNLFHFLVYHNLYQKWARNVKTTRNKDPKKIIETYNYTKVGLEDSFWWKNTPEGWDYWNEWDEKYKEYMDDPFDEQNLN